jgi:DNA-binding response OmpR family regulator
MRILVVEDDYKIGGFLEQGLREEGFEVDRADDGEEAVAKGGAGRYDLILLDYMLPKKNGLQVATELRASDIRTPILMLTARDPGEDAQASLAAGVSDFVGKPFRFNDLLGRIRSLVPIAGSPGVTLGAE